VKNSVGVEVPTIVTVEIDPRFCKGCGLCVQFCEQGVLEISETPNSRGVYAARVAHGVNCIGCKKCTLICPEAGIRLTKP